MTHRFDCLSATLEMPYKDLVEYPEPTEGWNPEKCQQLGAAILNAIDAVLPHLREEVSESVVSDLPAWVLPSYKNPEWEEPTYGQ